MTTGKASGKQIRREEQRAVDIMHRFSSFSKILFSVPGSYNKYLKYEIESCVLTLLRMHVEQYLLGGEALTNVLNSKSKLTMNEKCNKPKAYEG